MDVGSTKERLLDVVRHHARRGRYVATHPMAGTEFSGPEAAVPGLFANKCTVLIDEQDSDADAVEIVKRLYHSIPMQMVSLNGKAHDLHTAYVSHISHISSFALALTVLAKEKEEQKIFELASGGFSSTVRLAKSSPDMWIPIFRQNRDNVLDVLDEHINQLARFRSLLIKQDFDQFYQLITSANRIEKILNT
jgi:prephenate dehydrogenase